MRSNVINLKWVFSWEWKVVRMALGLVPMLEDLSGSDPSQGDTVHLGTHLPMKPLSPTRSELASKIPPLLLMSQQLHYNFWALDGRQVLPGPSL